MCSDPQENVMGVCRNSPPEDLGEPTPILFPNFQRALISADDFQRKYMKISPKQAAGCHKPNQSLDFTWFGLQQTRVSR